MYRFLFIVVSICFFTSCNFSDSGKVYQEILLSEIPYGSGEIEILPERGYNVGENVTITARAVQEGHFFYKWRGTIANRDSNTTFDSTIQFVVPDVEGVVLLEAIFPEAVIADGKIIICKFPDDTINSGESAYFGIIVDMPYDSKNPNKYSANASPVNGVLDGGILNVKSSASAYDYASVGKPAENSKSVTMWNFKIIDKEFNDTIVDTTLVHNVIWK